jgi:SAM-dependent methyltransferase
MKRGLISHLACPQCQATFDICPELTDGAEILEGKLVCSGCKAAFPIIRGVPRILSAELSSAKRATAEAFGYEWTHYSKLTAADEAEFLDWIKPLTPECFVGRVVLDAGCGKGRHIALAAQFQAREVVGVDLSDAVDAAYQNTRHLPNVHVVQADIFDLPFARHFDLIYSIGVLHHLPDPKRGFLSLTRHVRPGGRIAIWVYGKEGNRWIERFVDPLRIHVTSKLPKPITRSLSFILSVPLYAALKLVYGPVHRNRKLATLKSHLPYAEYLCAISSYSFAENFWNVFDHLVAPTAFYHSRDEVEEWFAAAGIKEIEISPRNENSWRGTGTLPEIATGNI